MITFTYSSFGKTAETRASPLGYGTPAARIHSRWVPFTRPGVSPPVGGDTAGQLCSFFSRLRIHRISASMKASISPSRTPEVFPVSAPVRTSLTLWYGCST